MDYIQDFLLRGQVGAALLRVQKPRFGRRFRQDPGSQGRFVRVEQDPQAVGAELLPDFLRGLAKLILRFPHAPPDLRRHGLGDDGLLVEGALPGVGDGQAETLADLQVNRSRQQQDHQQEHSDNDLFSHASSRKR